LSSDDDYRAAVSELHGRAAAAWPGIAVAAADFAELVAEKLAGSAATRDAVAALPGADLYLACACAAADPRALAAFDALYLAGAPAALARMHLGASEVDEVLQIVREKLLVAAGPGRPPRIRELAGRGSLDGLVRVVAIRTALNLRRARRRRSEHPDGSLVDVLMGETDPAAGISMAEARAELKRAFEQALARLDARQRNLLRLHLCHRLGIDDIGRLHQVHRATAARWLERIREQLRRDTRAVLSAVHGGRDSAIEDLLHLADSQLHISFERLLATRPGPADPG
jgi:RNA polymerase sigma-70 factor (ECF subfamily)